MKRRTRKLVVADKRDWAEATYLGDNDPKDFPQAVKRVNEMSFQVIEIHNSIEFKIGEHLLPGRLEDVIRAGWQVQLKAHKEGKV